MGERIEASADLKEWRARSAERNATPDIVPGVPVDLSHSVDAYGSLVTVPPADWLIGFVPGLNKQWWHRFADAKHKHVFALRPLDTGEWILVETWWTRLMVTVLPSADAVKFLRWGATGDILKVREAVPGRGNQLRGWANCAAIAAFVLGRRSKSFTPHGLYLELVRDGAEHQDVETLLVEQFTKVLEPAARRAMHIDAASREGTLEDVLIALGRNILIALMSPALLRLCYTAIIEAKRYPRAAAVYHEQGLAPTMATLAEILDKANEKGETQIVDCRRAAGQFIAMLRGDIHFEVMLELRPAPGIAEIEARARSAAAVFLRGARPIKRRAVSRPAILPPKPGM